jgi:hypothetical protein
MIKTPGKMIESYEVKVCVIDSELDITNAVPE